MANNKLVVFALSAIVGALLSPVSLWTHLLASKVTSYCAPPTKIKSVNILKNWEILLIPKIKNSQFVEQVSNHSKSEYLFDECKVREIIELEETLINGSKSVHDMVSYGELDKCSNGHRYREPGKSSSMISQFDMVCDREWLLPACHAVISAVTIITSVIYLLIWSKFDLRWAFAIKTRTLVAIITGATEVFAFTIDVPIEVFIIVRIASTILFTFLMMSTMFAAIEFYSETLDDLSEDFMAIGGAMTISWTASYLINSLMTGHLSWRLIAMISIGFPLIMLIIIGLAIRRSRGMTLTGPIMVNSHFFNQNVIFMSEASTSCGPRELDGHHVTPEMSSNSVSVYQSCEERLSMFPSGTSKLDKLSLTIHMILIAMSTLFYYMLIYSRESKSCFERTCRTWCFSYRPVIELFATLTVVVIRFKFGSRGSFISAMAIALVCSSVSTLTVINREVMSAPTMAVDFVDESFEFSLKATSLFCASVATIFAWTSHLHHCIRSKAFKTIFVAGLVGKSTYSVAPTLEFLLLKGIKERQAYFLTISWLIVFVLIIYGLSMKRIKKTHAALP